MAALPERYILHLLRRAGFGARPDERDLYGSLSISDAVDRLLNYTRIPDSVDANIGSPGYAGITTRGLFLPQSSIVDARQRWLFRMIHSDRPLQEKMTLFWHNHFATGFDKIATALNPQQAARYMAARSAEDSGGVRGQLEMLRDNALGNFRDLLLNIARDTAMLIWLDGSTNTKVAPQENFARELMELFTMGVGHYTESDVYAAARVFTGWNLRRVVPANPGPPVSIADDPSSLQFFFDASAHETSSKTFSFPIYPNGGNTIPARPASDGVQDGVDLIEGLAANPNTPRYLAGKLFRFFVSEFRPVDPAFVDRIAAVYFASGYDMRAVVREVFLSPQFWDDSSMFARYSWPAEFVVRAIKEIGWVGYSVDDARAAMTAMGQDLYAPPDVAGWDAGETWFTSGAMLARMNFAAALAGNQRFNIAARARTAGRSPESLLSFFLDELVTAPIDRGTLAEYINYLDDGGPWTGSGAQVESKSAGLVRLLAGSPEYQLI